jgi:competence protein ComEA
MGPGGVPRGRRAAVSGDVESPEEEKMFVRRMFATSLAVAMAVVLAAAPALAAAKSAPTEKVNLNTATVEQLTTLPGVGPTLAARIVEHREKAGPFGSPQELLNVKGIGEKNFQKIEQWLTVEASPRKASK